ncbi:lipocalin family protein [Phenylobacterium sp.]|uniref:lipocalin family protein n=1 Tax=Phenylobacterium sp. TaxID=1871053 RepID=UPI00272EEC5E|nr:lipocalin family protein [Phenylobacterium sp.]MDP2213897.1 lipocalin family protein [Phenylobacterium sp.]
MPSLSHTRLRPFVLSLVCAGLLSALPSLAAAAAPEPANKVELTKMTGRWYEVARTPNAMQKACEAATADWTRTGAGYSVVQTCRRGTPDGPKKEWKANATPVDPVKNAKFKLSFFGGVMNQEYWILDHGADDGWLIMGTPGGNYVWLLSKAPQLSAAVRSQAIARIRQLGYDTSKLEFPQQVR